MTNNEDSQGHELSETGGHVGQLIFRQHGADVNTQYALAVSDTAHPGVSESAQNGCHQMFERPPKVKVI